MKISKRKLYIHVGMHKTGSTSIQDTFFRLSPSRNYTYLDLGTLNHNHLIYSMFCDFPEKYYLNNKFSGSEIKSFNKKNKINLDTKLDSITAQKVFLSGEDIIHLSEKSLYNLQSYFSKYFKEIAIYAYVREPSSYIPSLMQQTIKSGVGFERFLNENRKGGKDDKLNVEMFYPAYRNLFKKFENVFGRENVILKLFDKRSLYRNDVVLDFFNHFNIKVENHNIIRSNDSISAPAIAAIYTLRKISNEKKFSAISESVERIIKAISILQGNKIELSSSTLNFILEKYREDIEWIESRIKEKIITKENTSFSKRSIETERDLQTLEISDYFKILNILRGLNLSDEIRNKIEDVIYKNNVLENKLVFSSNNENTSFKNLESLKKQKKNNGEIVDVTIIGMSHTGALAVANKRYETLPALKILNLNNRQQIENLTGSYNKAYPEGLIDKNLENYLDLNGDFISMMGGNMYNTFGLIEHPVKFDFVSPKSKVKVLEHREIIPYSLLHEVFKKRIEETITDIIEKYRKLFKGNIYHICSPPPVYSNEHLIRYPGVFNDKIHLGISKPHFRKNLYDLHSSIIKDYCKSSKVVFIPPPPLALDSDGFLKQEYVNEDPTHANLKYGKLVLEQLTDILNEK